MLPKVSHYVSPSPGTWWRRYLDGVVACVYNVNSDGSIAAESTVGYLQYDGTSEWINEFESIDEPKTDSRDSAVYGIHPYWKKRRSQLNIVERIRLIARDLCSSFKEVEYSFSPRYHEDWMAMWSKLGGNINDCLKNLRRPYSARMPGVIRDPEDFCSELELYVNTYGSRPVKVRRNIYNYEDKYSRPREKNQVPFAISPWKTQVV